MELYLQIFKLFLDREAFQRYGSGLDREFLRSNFPNLLRILNAIARMHEVVPESGKAVIGDLQAVFYSENPKADLSIFDPLFAKIAAADASPESTIAYLRATVERATAAKMAFTALDYAEGRATSDALQDAVEEWAEAKANPTEAAEEEFVTDDVEKLFSLAVSEGGLRWRLGSLNRALGPLRKGDFGFIFARPETGKTTFLASEVSYMARQTEAPILWINNEEQGEKVRIRILQAVLGAPLERIQGDFKRAQAEYEARTGKRIKVKDDSGISRSGVERLCEVYKPALIVVDQLDKISGFNADREDLHLGVIYQWARELAKRYAPVIGVSQSDGTGEGVKYLNMGNVANAKTAKQAEADFILGIGYAYQDPPNVRGFSICKNKLLGGQESVPTMRHGKWEVLIQPEIARYIDVK